MKQEHGNGIEFYVGTYFPRILCAAGMTRWKPVRLRWRDIKDHFATVRDTKNGDTRRVPLSEKAEHALKEWGRRHMEYVFPSLKGDGPLGLLSHAFARLAERAKVSDVRYHDLRHGFCTRMVEAGADLITLKEITGHRTLTMLQRYTHPSEARKLALVRPTEQTTSAQAQAASGGR
ncbi:MAG: tyrosine-type recombinase/integrase [Candidatus Polarisedimenticolia bacterium]